ncbi:MAG: alkaline phosphatase D family protein [Planctomycetota bacterium]|nr:alkaline phosphatase D family protein [Planctomycetota bacterium]
MKRIGALCIAAGLQAAGIGGEGAGGVHFANGIKIGEVSQDSALVWVRLTRRAERLGEGQAFARDAAAVPAGKALERMRNSVEGARGEVRVSWWPVGAVGARLATGWFPVDPAADFTTQIRLDGLRPGVSYELEVEGRRDGAVGPRGVDGTAATKCSLRGAFTTAGRADEPQRVVFTVVTGQDFTRRDDPVNGHRIYPAMKALEPSFFVHTGDIVYYDKPGPFAKNEELARFKWNRLYALPFQRAFHREVASYFQKDDHDTLRNDCWPGQRYGELTWEDGLRLFREQVPMGERTWRRARWGMDLEVWFVEGRDFRSPNPMTDGPEKTILGAEQKAWLFETLAASDATFRVLVSPTPIVGPDRSRKNDNHANAGFATEGNEVRAFLGSQEGAFVVCGDRHWQYVSVDARTGLREVSCGPTSDAHAGGFSERQRTDAHRFLRVGGGFLSVTVERADSRPTITFRHHAVDGSVVHEQAHERSAAVEGR